MAEIGASVGNGGVNRDPDVRVVQGLLVARGFQIGRPDGICGNRTKAAIVTFQRGFMTAPDGRVDPGGQTFRRLSQSTPAPAPADTTGSLTRLLPRPDRSTLNPGLTAVNNTLMTNLFGAPRDSYSADCQPVTNTRLKRNMTSGSVGPFTVTGLSPAIASLREVMQDIAKQQSEVYRALGTAGMLCARYVRGSTTSISNHSWGTAVDLKLNGVLDARGDNKVQYGLTLIAPIFNRHGWYWGAGFPTEDAMHFEASRSLVEGWAHDLT